VDNSTIAALAGAAVGGSLTIISNFVLESYRTAAHAEQLAHAIAGEVVAILEIVKRRGYVTLLEEHRSRALRGERVSLNVKVAHNYFATIEATLDSIGMLPAELPLLIPQFLTYAKSAIEDLSLIENPSPAMPARQLAGIYGELIDVLSHAIKNGQSIVALVAAIYGSPHGRLSVWIRMRQWAAKAMEEAG
jgi:hypothetical protein